MNTDIQIRYKNTDYSFNLALDPQTGQKRWKIWDSKTLPPMFTSDRPLYAHVPPEKELLIEQDYFHAGMGEEFFEHGKRYYNSPGCDARRKGAVLLGPTTAKATIFSTAATIVNAGFEDGVTTGWTDLDAVSTGGAQRTGTWCGTETVAAGTPEVFYQTNTTTYATYKGISLTLTAYVRYGVLAANKAKLTIDDGIGTTTGTEVTLTDTFQAVTVTRLISTSATQLKISATTTQTADTGIAHWDDFTLIPTLGTKSVVVKFCDYAGYTYAADGDMLLRWTGSVWVPVLQAAHTITDLCVWTSYLFLCEGTAYKYEYWDGSAATLTTSTIADGQMQYMGLVGTTVWGNDSTYNVQSSTNPLNGGSWASDTTIGNSNSTITGILNHPDKVLVAEQNAFCQVNATGTVTNWIPELQQESHAYTGKNCCVWKGMIYVPSGYGSLYELNTTDSVITAITPSDSIPGQSTFMGKVLAMWGDALYLYVILDNATKIEILAGHWEIIENAAGNNVTDWWWHQMQEQTLTDADSNVRSCIISALPSVKYLHLGCSSTTDGIYYSNHPTLYGDVTQDTNYRFDTAGDFYTAWLESVYPHALKTFYSLTVRNSGTSATETIAVSYDIDATGSFTALGTADAAPEETFYFPLNVSGKRIQLKFSLASGASTTTPALKGFTLRCTARPFNLEEGRLTLNESLEFRTYGGFETSWQHAEFRDVNKNFYGITVLSENLSTTNYITFKYRLDDDAIWTTHDVLIDTSPEQIIYFPKETVGKILYVFFTPATTTGDLIAYIIDGVLRPIKRKEMEFALDISSKQATRTGGISNRNVQVLAQTLREIDNSTWPVTLKTFDGQEYQVIFQNMQEEMSLDAKFKDPEYVFTVRALEASLEV